MNIISRLFCANYKSVENFLISGLILVYIFSSEFLGYMKNMDMKQTTVEFLY